MIATNLHADTYEQARAQVCGENGVPPTDFRRVNLLYFLHVDNRGWAVGRRIAAVWESDGEQEHRQVFDLSEPHLSDGTNGIVTADRLTEARLTIDTLMASDARSIEEVRTHLVEVQAWKIRQDGRQHNGNG